MNRPQSRWQIRQAAARAFTMRNRLIVENPGLREPEPHELCLSAAEVQFGIEHGLISAHPAHARATEGAPSP